MSKNRQQQPSGIPNEPSGALAAQADYRRALKPPDPFKVINQDPSRHYRWLSKRKLERNGGVDRNGYQVITQANSKGERMATAYNQAIGGSDIQFEDLVLGFQEKEIWQLRQNDKDAARRFFSYSIQGFREDVKHRDGVSIFDDNISIQQPGRSDQVETNRI